MIVFAMCFDVGWYFFEIYYDLFRGAGFESARIGSEVLGFDSLAGWRSYILDVLFFRDTHPSILVHLSNDSYGQLPRGL